MQRKKVVLAASAEMLEEAISSFLSRCGAPVLQEPGEDPIPLQQGSYEFSRRAHRLLLSAWDDRRTWSRRVTAAEPPRSGRLHLVIEKFSGKQAPAWIYDSARPEAPAWDRKGALMIFREQFRRMLQRTFPGWRIVRLSSEKDLEHTLSANYPRGLVTQGNHGWAVIAAPQQDPDSALSFGLIWLDYVRRLNPRLAIAGLTLFLPRDQTQTTALRLRYLDPAKAEFRIHAYEGETAELLDRSDWGNLRTALEPCRHSVIALPPWVAQFGAAPDIVPVPLAGGVVSFRLAGLELARWRDGELRAGIDGKRPHGIDELPELLSLAAHVSTLRHLPGSLLHQRAPEAWLESTLRQELQQLDPRLLPDPVYGQVPTLSGTDRGIADLLAVDRAGRLAVIEVKTSEDLHLPLQALDYWMRVAWHADRDEFRSAGYFPGIPLSRERPRLLLVAPALQFHPTTETILSYFSSHIEVERIGVGVKWRESLQLLYRLNGADSPR